MAGESPEPDAVVSREVVEQTKEFIAFGIAEAVKRQIKTWALWTFAPIVAVVTFLGFTTWEAMRDGMVNATTEAAKKAAADARSRFEEMLDLQLSDLRRQSDDAVKNFRSQTQESLKEFDAASRSELQRIEQRFQNVISEVEVSRSTTIARLEELGRLPGEAPPTAATQPRTVNRRGRERPVGPGLSISSTKSTAGTICCLVRDEAGERFLLTAYHVLAEKGAAVIQPGGFDGGGETRDRIGVVSFIPEIGEGTTLVRNGAGLIRLDPDLEVYADLPELGLFTGVGDPQLGDVVLKYGRTTGLTRGKVRNIHMSTKIAIERGRTVTFTGLFAVAGEEGRFTEGGDSGSPVVNEDGRLLGIAFAGSATVSLILPIQPMLSELGLSLVTEQ